MSEKRLLALILALFLLLGFSYALVTPVFEASDELWHYPMIQHLAQGNPLPVQVFDPALAGPWKQEASQPPLYYYLGAALTFWIDASDMPEVRWLNPHVDNGIITPDGNINLAIHDPAHNPWQGTLLAVRLVRLFSVLLSAGTVLLTYLIAREVAPGRPEIALGATAVNAFLPMFLFISGAVNNDNLAILLASLAVWLMIRLVSRAIRPGYHYWLLLGSVIGLGLLTKQGTFALLPLAWGTAFISQWQQRPASGKSFWHDLGRAFGRSLLIFGWLLLPVSLIAGWWYYRNIALYGDFLGWNAFIAVLGARAQPASLAQLWGERVGFMMSFWGLFGGVNVPMPGWIYSVLNGALLTAVVGFVIYLGQQIRAWFAAARPQINNLTALLQALLAWVIAFFGLVVCLLFAGAVIFGLIQWATTTWSSQGRLVFTAISALSILLALGLAGWLPPRLARWPLAALGGFLLLVAALAPWLWIRPAYIPPKLPGLAAAPEALFGEQLRLVGYEVTPTAVTPGSEVWVTLEWEVLAPMDRDWSVFVHLNDPVLGRPIAQRDMYPGQGLLATRLLEPGQRLVNRYRLSIPTAVIAPATLQTAVGLYDYATCPACERLPVSGGALPATDNAVILAEIPLQAAAGDLPNPTQVNFGNTLELVGFALEPRHAAPGEVVDLTLYWRALRPLSTDYHFFAQVVAEDTTRWAALDLPPEGQALPTSQWPVGDIQTISLPLTLDPNAPADVYPLIVGAYTIDNGEFNRLQLVTENGRITQDNFLTLTPLRITGP